MRFFGVFLGVFWYFHKNWRFYVKRVFCYFEKKTIFALTLGCVFRGGGIGRKEGDLLAFFWYFLKIGVSTLGVF